MNEYARRELEPPAVPLSRGSLGPDVKRLQEWLCLHGFHTAVDGDFGPATQAALKEFQASELMEADGGVADGACDAATWEALTAPLANAGTWTRDGMGVAVAIVHAAEMHLMWGSREVGKPNGGPWVRYFCRGLEVPWCAGFATTVLGQALGHDEWYTLSCDELAQKGMKRGTFLAGDHHRTREHVRRGALFLVRRAHGDWVHTGIVTAVHAEHFETMEGNTNLDGSREGTAVHARVRAFRHNVDFVLIGEDP